MTVTRAMLERDWTVLKLSEEAKVNFKTTNEFILGNQWPRRDTLGKLDRALGFAAGTLALMADGLLGESELARRSKVATSDRFLCERDSRFTDGQWLQFREFMKQAALYKMIDLGIDPKGGE